MKTGSKVHGLTLFKNIRGDNVVRYGRDSQGGTVIEGKTPGAVHQW